MDTNIYLYFNKYVVLYHAVARVGCIHGMLRPQPVYDVVRSLLQLKKNEEKKMMVIRINI